MSDVIINKVAESGLIELDLEKFYPKQEQAIFDLKDYLYMGLILKEKDFREALKKFDFEIYREKLVAVTCTADAIIPMWAYMLVASYLQPVAKDFVFGDMEYLHKSYFIKNIQDINVNDYLNKRVVVKGCGDVLIAEYAYLEITKRLLPVAKSIMYGEPCSTVPVFKKPTT